MFLCRKVHEQNLMNKQNLKNKISNDGEPPCIFYDLMSFSSFQLKGGSHYVFFEVSYGKRNGIKNENEHQKERKATS